MQHFGYVNSLGGVGWRKLVGLGYQKSSGSWCGIYGNLVHPLVRFLGKWVHHQVQYSRSFTA